jgi:hypothetical protein
MIKPDYDGGSIVNLMSSLASGLGGQATGYPPASLLPAREVEKAKAVVLIVIDGLGYHYLNRASVAPDLRAACRGSLTSVFPSTTASAITTYLTGDAPSRHGVTGWHMYMRELGAVITVLPGRARFGGARLADVGIDLPGLLDTTAFMERLDVPAAMVMPQDIADSAFTLAHAGHAAMLPHDGLDDMMANVVSAIEDYGARYVHAYWSSLDSIGHRHGMNSVTARDELGAINNAFAFLIERLRDSGTTVVLCADHGQIDTRPGDWMIIDRSSDAADSLVLPLTGEPRAAFAHSTPGGGDAFARQLDAQFGPRSQVVSAQDWRNAGWYGPGPHHHELASRTGDLLVLPKEHCAIKDWLPTERPYSTVGVHGGTTPDEMQVPLVVAQT